MKLANFLVACVGVVCFWAAPALAWDAFPELGAGQNYAGGAGWESRPLVQKCLSELSTRSEANYYAAVVNNTSPMNLASDNDAVPYVDALTTSWGARLRPDLDVVLALGIDNRAVAIHPGSTWVRLGFETQLIKETIDASTFKNFARSQDYDGAVCALAQAVEQRLTALKAAETRTLDEARLAAPALRLEVVAVRAKVMDIAHVEARQALLDRLVPVEGSVDELVFALGQKNVPEVRRHLSDAQAGLRGVKDTLSEMGLIGAQISKLKLSQQSFENELAGTAIDADSQAELNARMATCSTLLPGELEVAQRGLDLSRSERCIEEVWRDYNDKKIRHFMLYRFAPMALLALLIVFGLVTVAVVGVRRRRAMVPAKAQLDSWEEKLDRAGERLIALESSYAAYLSQGKTKYTGQTEDLDRRAADAVNLLFLMYGQAVLLKGKASKLFDEALVFQVGVFGECVRLLTVTEVVFETGISETQLRVFMPLSRSYRGTATGLLADLDAQYEEAARLLDHLQRQIEQAFEHGETLRAALEAGMELLESRAEAGFPVQVYSDDMAKIEVQRSDLAREIVVDPVKANTHATEIIEAAQALVARLELGNQALATLVKTVTPAAQALRAEVSRLRESGWKLEEPGFDPDVSLDHANLVARELREALGRCQDAEANEVSLRLQRMVDQVGEQVRQSVEARQEIPGVLAEQAGQVEKLQAAIPLARQVLTRLNAEHAAQTFGVESDNLEELAQVLSQTSTWMIRVRDAHAREAYLAATADAQTCWAMLDAGQALIREIHDVDARLARLRDEALQMRGACERLAQKLGSQANSLGVGAECRGQIQAMLDAVPGVAALQEGTTPDWPMAHREIGNLQDRLEILVEQVDAGIVAAEQARRTVEHQGEVLGVLVADVQREWRDRPHVERMIEAVRDEMPDYEAKMQDLGLPGATMEMSAGELVERVSQARALWETERELIHDATAELSRTLDRYSTVVGHRYEFSVRAELSKAFEVMEEARAAQGKLEWDVALTQARRAQTLIETEHNNCERRVREERERRRKAVSRASSYSSSSSSSSRSSSSSSFGSRSSSFSSSSSWKSSSSGGSSYKSSSGGSSW